MEPINQSTIPWTTVESDGGEIERKKLGEHAAGSMLGCSLYELPPDTRAWRYHYHTANEEALYVLAGSGTVRIADTDHDLEPGDYVAFPADERGAHRVRNDGDHPLRYLAVSTMNEPDVTVYPDDERIGVFVGSAPGSEEPRTVQG